MNNRKIVVLGCQNDWCAASLDKPIKENIIKYFDKIVVDNLFFKLLFSSKINHIFKVPLKFVYYKKIDEIINISGNEIILVYDQFNLNCDINLYRYLKKAHPNITLVYLFTNIIEHSKARYYKYDTKLRDFFDFVFCFDREDAKKYEYDYHGLLFDRLDAKYETIALDCDLFFVGQAKDRVDRIVNIYDMALRESLSCYFYCTNYNDKSNFYSSKNIFYDKYLKYETVICKIKSSKAVVDIMQQNSTGITLNICDAIFFNKKIITDNLNVKFEPWYNPNRIYLIGEEDRTITDFLLMPMNDFSDTERYYFSLSRLIDRIGGKDDRS